jgi:predicted nucleic acid-binding protein
VIVVSNSSPLISLAKIDAFDLLQKLYGALVIPAEVYAEVVSAGAGLAGAAEVSKCPWIEVREIRHPAAMDEIRSRRLALGLGELSAMILARELAADLVLLDDLGARKLAQKQGMKVQGCIAVLEACYRRGHVADLRQAYERMLQAGVYLDRKLLNRILTSLEIAPLQSD